MCNTSKCKYENSKGNCTAPKVPEDALCYHSKVDALSVDMSFKIAKAMRERERVGQEQVEIFDRLMMGHRSNTAIIIEQHHVDYRRKRQAIIDELAKDASYVIDGEVSFEYIGDSTEGAQVFVETAIETNDTILAFDYAEAEVKIASTFPTKAEIDAAVTGRMSKINRIKAVRALTDWTILASKHYVEELYE